MIAFLLCVGHRITNPSVSLALFCHEHINLSSPPHVCTPSSDLCYYYLSGKNLMTFFQEVNLIDCSYLRFLASTCIFGYM